MLRLKTEQILNFFTSSLEIHIHLKLGINSRLEFKKQNKMKSNSNNISVIIVQTKLLRHSPVLSLLLLFSPEQETGSVVVKRGKVI